jgi:hypothetical protein
MLLSEPTISFIYGAFILRALLFSVPLAWKGYHWYKSKVAGLGCLLKAITDYFLLGVMLVVIAIPPFVAYKLLNLIPSKEVISVAKEGNEIFTQTQCLYGRNSLDKDGFQVSFSAEATLAILNYSGEYLKVCQVFESEDGSIEFKLIQIISPLGSYQSPYVIGCMVPESSLLDCLSNKFSLPEAQYHIVW